MSGSSRRPHPRSSKGADAAKAATKRARRETARLERERQVRRRGRAQRLRSAGITAAVVVVLGGVGLAVFRAGSGVAFAGDLREGGRLERLELPRLEGEGTVDYAGYADKPVVVNFFASWCPNCIAEMPDFERVHQELGDRVVFLGVSQQDAENASIDLARQTGITYATGIDPQGTFFNAIAGQGMPTTVFVEPGGEIASVQVGQLSAEDLRELIERHLGVRA